MSSRPAWYYATYHATPKEALASVTLIEQNLLAVGHRFQRANIKRALTMLVKHGYLERQRRGRVRRYRRIA